MKGDGLMKFPLAMIWTIDKEGIPLWLVFVLFLTEEAYSKEGSRMEGTLDDFDSLDIGANFKS